MADSRAATGLTVEQWDRKFFREYASENRFSGDMGTKDTDIIQVKENLTKQPGDKINFALVNRLQQDATTGRAQMEGNEEDLISRSHKIEVELRRNAVVVHEVDEQKSAISLRNAAKPQLKEWAMKDTESLICQALGSINGVNYADADETQKDAWLTDNRDRVYFGSGYAGVDHSAGLLELDATTDKFTAQAARNMKYQARITAGPKIKPIRSTTTGRHYFIAYCDPGTFWDLQEDPVVKQAQREVSIIRENERIFQGGDILYDGIIFKEIEAFYDELRAPLAGKGTAGANVGCVFLCGAQALGIAYAQRWKTATEDFDYGKRHGVETSAFYGVDKLTFGSAEDDEDGDQKDHGVVTGYFGISK